MAFPRPKARTITASQIGYPRPAYQFFGRIIRAELACPACGSLHEIGSGKSPFWDPLASRFRCRRCQRRFDLGILAWQPAPARPGPPADTFIDPMHPSLGAALHSRVTEYIRTRSDVVNQVAAVTKDGEEVVAEEGGEADVSGKPDGSQ